MVRGTAPSAEPLSEGEIILNFNSSNHTPELGNELLHLMHSRPKILRLTVLRDAATPEAEWAIFKGRLNAAQGFETSRIAFADEEGYGSLREVFEWRLAERQIEPDDTVQLVSPLRTRKQDALYYEESLLGAAPLGQETIVIMGSSEALAKARHFGLEEVLEAALVSTRLIDRSA